MSSSILDFLGIDPEDVKWYHLATCNGLIESIRQRVPAGQTYKYDPFFDAYEADVEVRRQTDAMCLGCPVIKQCMKDGIAQKSDGVRGGIYLNLGRVDKNFNSHKTPETWKALKKIHGKTLKYQ